MAAGQLSVSAWAVGRPPTGQDATAGAQDSLTCYSGIMDSQASWNSKTCWQKRGVFRQKRGTARSGCGALPGQVLYGLRGAFRQKRGMAKSGFRQKRGTAKSGFAWFAGRCQAKAMAKSGLPKVSGKSGAWPGQVLQGVAGRGQASCRANGTANSSRAVAEQSKTKQSNDTAKQS